MSRQAVTTRSKILESAELVFGEAGFAKTRLEDVAAGAGVRRPSLLHHFSSKAVLYADVVRLAFDELSGVLMNAVAMLAGLPFQDVLQGITRELMTFSKNRPAVLSLVFRELLDPCESGSELLQGGLEPLLDRLEEFIALSSGGTLDENFPIRESIVSLFLLEMARAAVSPSAHQVLWKSKASRTSDLVAVLFRNSSYE